MNRILPLLLFVSIFLVVDIHFVYAQSVDTIKRPATVERPLVLLRNPILWIRFKDVSLSEQNLERITDQLLDSLRVREIYPIQGEAPPEDETDVQLQRAAFSGNTDAYIWIEVSQDEGQGDIERLAIRYRIDDLRTPDTPAMSSRYNTYVFNRRNSIDTDIWTPVLVDSVTILMPLTDASVVEFRSNATNTRVIINNSEEILLPNSDDVGELRFIPQSSATIIGSADGYYPEERQLFLDSERQLVQFDLVPKLPLMFDFYLSQFKYPALKVTWNVLPDVVALNIGLQTEFGFNVFEPTDTKQFIATDGFNMLELQAWVYVLPLHFPVRLYTGGGLFVRASGLFTDGEDRGAIQISHEVSIGPILTLGFEADARSDVRFFFEYNPLLSISLTHLLNDNIPVDPVLIEYLNFRIGVRWHPPLP